MSSVQPIAPPPSDDAPLASVTPLSAAYQGASVRDDWLTAIERAWGEGGARPAAVLGRLREVRSIRQDAEAVGDEFVVAAADVVLLRESAAQGRHGEAIAGLVPAAADLETYPASSWLGRAHGVIAETFAELGETDRAAEHLEIEQEVGEAVADLALQASALHRSALLLPAGTERLEALSNAEILYTRASVDGTEAGLGRLDARLDRAVTTVELGLLASAEEQLPTVVAMAAAMGRSGQEARATALLARCTALAGDLSQGEALAHRALDLSPGLSARSRHEVVLDVAQAYLASRRADLAVHALQAPEIQADIDPCRHGRVLVQLAEAYERLGRREDAYRTLREADRIEEKRTEQESRARLEALRVYHRVRAAENELSTQRDLSAKLFEQVSHLGDIVPGAGELAVRDDVTGLPNRRYLDLELRWRCSQRLPGRNLLGLVLVQLDDYDALVAALGQAGTDRLVAAAGQVVRGNVRSGDAVARYSPDTFAVIQFHRSVEAARFAGERLRLAVSGFPWVENHLGRSVTASVGVAAVHPPTTPGVLTGRSHGALAEAVAAGGDRVVVSG